MKTKILFLVTVSAAVGLFISSCSKKDNKVEEMPQVAQLVNGSVTANGDTIMMVDLGLQSGTKWADRNVGASTPASPGMYFAWGETSEKESYSWETYMCSKEQCWTESDPIFTKLGGDKSICGTEFDAVTAFWGTGYMMPTDAQIEELMDSTVTVWTWTVMTDKDGNEVSGYTVTGRVNGNSIFLPISGCRKLDDVLDVGTDGHLWSGGRDVFESDRAGRLKYGQGARVLGHPQRYYGRPVRAVSK